MIEANSAPPWELVLLVLSIAFLYASVGFGGASGYLAAMSFFAISPSVMSSTALTLNILVSSIAFGAYYRARHFVPRLLWPFLITSIPFSFAGGYIDIEQKAYLMLLYLVLGYMGLRLLFHNPLKAPNEATSTPVSLIAAIMSGAIIGLLSGIIGIGGGIFLAPLIVTAEWGSAKQAGASAAAFVAINSTSGLVGRLSSGNLELGLLGVYLMPIGLIGALGGSRLGANYLSGVGLRRLLGVVLLVAVLRFWLQIISGAMG